MSTSKRFLKIFIPIAKAVAALLAPHAEVVIHDLTEDRIFYICGNYSGRKKGDNSLLGQTKFEAKSDQFYPPYFKSSQDGEPQRSVSAVLADEDNIPKGLLCINVDIGEIEQAKKILSEFMPRPSTNEQPNELFEFDWREQINLILGNYLNDTHKKLKHLTRRERCELTQQLKGKGLLEARNSIDHLAKSLNVTRATIYNYLKNTDKDNYQ